MAKTTEINQAIGYAIKEGLARKSNRIYGL